MKSSNLLVNTAKGTTFHLSRKKVTIIKHDQPQCVIPLDDIKEFMRSIDNGDSSKSIREGQGSSS